jgi:hypothetical protein
VRCDTGDRVRPGFFFEASDEVTETSTLTVTIEPLP